jgi:UDPglucose 6-dehydrogenase
MLTDGNSGSGMNIAVIGAGYVGAVCAAGFASLGHTVRVGERDRHKVDELNAGRSPIYEQGLVELLADAKSKGTLSFHTNNLDAISGAEIVLLALPTPSASDGSADLTVVEAVLEGIAPHLGTGVVVVTKSTVPVGSAERFASILAAKGSTASVASNPEFLREGSAVTDFLEPDRIVIGADDRVTSDKVAEMYSGIAAPLVICDLKSAEMIKYASNAYLATRITFANSLASVCDTVGADVTAVLEGMGHDERIGSKAMKPGPGYGGSCFPKDTKALLATADDAGYDFLLLRSVIRLNEIQIDRMVDRVLNHLPNTPDRKVGMLGVAYKAGTDDVRQSPALAIAHRLMASGARVTAFDPAVRGSDVEGVELAESAMDAVDAADVVVLATEWPEFSEINLSDVATAMNGATIFDTRNVLDPEQVRDAGLVYLGNGR